MSVRRALLAFALCCLTALPLSAPAGAQRQSADFAGFVSIENGRSVYLECRGQGAPTVMLEAGLRNRGDIWNVADVPGGDADSVFSVIAKRNRVCEYDRPGTVCAADELSRSDPIRQPRTTAAIVRDLHQLLRAARVPGPYVMVGHSTGGLIARQYAGRHPKQIAGLVLVDAISEGMQDAMKPKQFAFYNRAYLIAAPESIAAYPDLETVDFYRSFDQLRRKPAPPRPIPEVTITKGKGFGAPDGVAESFADFVDRKWERNQRYLASLQPQIRRFFARESGHYVQVQQPALVVKAIRRVIRLARSSSRKSCQTARL
ncbi:MAG: alpha/beta hydrolase [Actinomycetota bacterium]|nr:alpha/beta hydrolase [Actinomycetota bacterium]